MLDEYRIEMLERPDDAAWSAIGGGIHAHNAAMAGSSASSPLCVVLRATDGAIAGGLIGEIHWNWFQIDLLWVREDLRGRGHGRRLLATAEEEARRRGATDAYLDTFSFQAPRFYAENGYRVFGELQSFPPGHTRLYLTKALR